MEDLFRSFTHLKEWIPHYKINIFHSEKYDRFISYIYLIYEKWKYSIYSKMFPGSILLLYLMFFHHFMTFYGPNNKSFNWLWENKKSCSPVACTSVHLQMLSNNNMQTNKYSHTAVSFPVLTSFYRNMTVFFEPTWSSSCVDELWWHVTRHLWMW